MTLSALGIFSAAGAGGGAALPAYELVSTQILASNQASVVFDTSTLASTYRHLQIRAVNRSSFGANYEYFLMRFNGDGSSNYSTHWLGANGVSVYSGAEVNTTRAILAISTGSGNTDNHFGAQVIDILDAFSTTKNKTTRGFSGMIETGNREQFLSSGNWRSTSAITSITLFPNSSTQWLTGSRFSLYGIRG